jgi:hypothetical protein
VTKVVGVFVPFFVRRFNDELQTSRRIVELSAATLCVVRFDTGDAAVARRRYTLSRWTQNRQWTKR